MQTSCNKIKAFTISEMIVVLMITVIVVGLVFTVLNLVQKQMGVIGENYEDTTELNLLRQALWVDFSKYAHIEYDANTKIMTCINEVERMDYVFGENWIIRQKDTFHVKTNLPSFFADGMILQSGSIDALKLTTAGNSSEKTIFVYGKNAANEYMK